MSGAVVVVGSESSGSGRLQRPALGQIEPVPVAEQMEDHDMKFICFRECYEDLQRQTRELRAEIERLKKTMSGSP